MEEIVNALQILGFDAFTNKHNFVTVKYGLTNQIPFEGIHHFLYPKEEEHNGIKFTPPSMTINDVVSMITNVHDSKISIRDDDRDEDTMSDKEVFDKMCELLKPKTKDNE